VHLWSVAQPIDLIFTTISVRQSLEKANDVLDFLDAQTRLVSRLWGERHFRIDVPVLDRRQVL